MVALLLTNTAPKPNPEPKRDPNPNPAVSLVPNPNSNPNNQVALLLKHGADPRATDAAGNTGATLAGKTGRRKSKELLEAAQAACKSADSSRRRSAAAA